MRYAVSIPASDAAGFDTTLTVEASDWMSALRTALAATTEVTPQGSDLLCDIQLDGAVRVIDARSQRTFHLRPLADGAAAAPAAGSDAAVGPSVLGRDTLDEVRRPARDELAAEGLGDPPRILERRRAPSGTFPPVEPPARVDEDLLERVLAELVWGYDQGAPRPLHEVTARVLDLALQLIPSESGAVLFPGLQGRDLFFAAARGPKAAEVMGFRVPLGRGIVGFCVREGVSLAVPRARQDGRLYRDIGDSIGHVPETIACAPLKCGGRVFGALELLNRSDAQPYGAADIALLTHIASQFAHWIQLHM